MNRRAFLLGLMATTAVASCGAATELVLAAAPMTDWKAYFEQWVKDVMDIQFQCYEDAIIFGACAWITIETYPFIERVDPKNLLPPKLKGGLFSSN